MFSRKVIPDLEILKNKQGSSTITAQFWDYDSSVSSALDELNFFDRHDVKHLKMLS